MFDYQIYIKNKAEQKKIFKNAELMMESNECASRKTKLVIWDSNVQNYFNDCTKPFADNRK